MRRIVVKEVRPGMVAARAVNRPDGTVLLPSGDTIISGHIAALHAEGVYDLWIVDAGFEFFDELCTSQPTNAQLRLADGMRKAFLGLTTLVERTQMKRFNLVIEDLVRGMLRNAAAVPCFGALTDDEGLLAHSCDVAALSIVLGLKLEGYLVEQRPRLNCRQAREILNLALGALFHDVGELMLPAPQRESRLASATSDADQWKAHVDDGYAIVRGRLDPTAAAIVLHHHQRFDGTGFASQKGNPGEGQRKAQHGREIHVYTRIVGAADMFCQTLFGQSGRIPQPMVKTLWQLQQLPLRNAFDPVVLECLQGLFAPFAEGMIVMLSDHRQALVTKVDSGSPCYPTVQTIAQPHMFSVDADTEVQKEQVIDLALNGDVMVEAVDGFPIKPFIFGVRKARPLVAA